MQEQLESLIKGDEVADGTNQSVMLLASFNTLSEATEEKNISDKISEMMDSLTEAKEELEEKISSIERLKDEKANLENEIEEKESQLKKVEKQLEELEGEKVDKSKLEAKLGEIQGLNQEDYTVDSWEALQSAVVVANQIVADKDATIDSVDSALDNLISTLRNLEIKEDPGVEEANNFKATHSEALALTVDGVKLSDEAVIDTALSAYIGLSGPAQTMLASEKMLLDNLQTKINELKQEASEQAAIEAVVVQINGLPSVEDLALTDKEAVEAARTAYDALTADQKALVTNIDKLIAAETKIMELEENIAYENLKSLVEAKVVAYELLAQADLTTQELIIAANEAKLAIVLDGLTEADITAFRVRIATADAKVVAAQAVLDNQAIANAVIIKINALLETITLANKEEVEVARVAYDALTADQKALVTNLDKLTAAESKIAELEATAAYESLKTGTEAKVVAYELLAQADLTTQELIIAANEAKLAIVLDGLTEADKEAFQTRVTKADALVAKAQTILDNQVADQEATEGAERFRKEVSTALSLEVGTVEVEQKAVVQAALTLYDKLPKPVQAKLGVEKTLLDGLMGKIEEIEVANHNATNAVKALIVSLPEIEALTLENKEAVEGARTAYNNLTNTQKGLISSTDLAKLVAAEGQISVLIADKEASDKASEFKEAHKDALALTVETVTVGNKNIVEAALAAFAELAPEVQAKLVDGEKTLLDSLSQKILELEQQAAEDQVAAETVDNLIIALPSVDDLILADKKDVVAVRTAYDALTDTRKALVTKLDLLNDIEARMDVLEKTVDLVGDEIINGHYVVNRNYTDNNIKTDNISSVTLSIGDEEVTDEFDINFYDTKDGQVITSFDLSKGGTTFKVYMVAKAKDGKDYYDLETDVFFKYGSVTIGNNDTYYTIEDALDKADSGTIFVKHNTSFADKEVAELIYGGTGFTINKGVTVLLPYSSSDLNGYTSTGFNPDGISSRKPVLFNTLTVPNNITLTVKGTVMVNAITGWPTAVDQPHDITGGYSQINLEGDIIVGNDGLLDVFGKVKGSGKIEALSGGSVGDLYVVQKWRGGTVASGAYGKKVFPFNQYDIKSIETDLKINSGASYYGNVKMYANSKYYYTRFYQFDDSKGLIKLNNGAYAIKSNNEQNITINGGAEEIGGAMNVAGINVKTEDYIFPIDGQYSFVLENGNYVINNKVKFLSGSSLSIKEDAILVIKTGAQLIIYNKFDDQFNVTSRRYPNNRQPSEMNLKGVLEVEGAFGGKINVTSVNSKVIVSNNGELKVDSNEILSANFLSGKTFTITEEASLFIDISLGDNKKWYYYPNDGDATDAILLYSQEEYTNLYGVSEYKGKTFILK